MDEHVPVSQTVAVTVIAQDPEVRRRGRIVTVEIRIPAEHLEPGPRGARFHVVDYDGATATLAPPVVLGLEEGLDAFANATDAELLADPGFRAQNVYAIAARTLAVFEAALGRRLRWRFDGPQLFLVPHAFPEANAYYSPEDGAVYFGYVPEGDDEVLTALSHDVVAHEVTHAILDGLRPGLVEPGLPDQPAFHEALADIVALLSIFSLPRVVEALLDDANAAGYLTQRQFSTDTLRTTALFSVADQLGRVLDTHGGALRRSVDMLPSTEWRENPAFLEPHRRAEVLVAAVMQTLLRMWHERLPRRGNALRSRVAEEGRTAAAHLLRMMTRGVDYLPPVELEFEDVVAAVLTADEIVAPDDEHHYRTALQEEFEAFGIIRPRDRFVDLSRGEQPAYDRMNYTLLRSDRDEVMRFIWDNADVFGIEREWRTRVDTVRSSVRIGPDGLLVPEVVATYVQELELTAAELESCGVELPPGVDPTTELQLLGGGVLVFDQFGRAKLHQHKPLEDWQRQGRRLAYLAERGLADSLGRFGYTLTMPRGQRFAALHVAGDRAGEDW